MQSAEQMQNSECRMQNAEAISEQADESEVQSTEQMQNSECRIQNAEAISEQADEGLEDMPKEAVQAPEAPRVNTKAHLTSSVPRAAKLPQGALTKGQMAEIRSIFGDIDDAEIQRLYKRVTKQN